MDASEFASHQSQSCGHLGVTEPFHHSTVAQAAGLFTQVQPKIGGSDSTPRARPAVPLHLSSQATIYLVAHSSFATPPTVRGAGLNVTLRS